MRESLRLSLHLVRRNWWVYRKDLIANISPTIADPAFSMVAFGLGLGAFMSNVQGHTYLGYLAPGLAVTTAMFTAFFETSYGFYVQMTFENVFKAMLTTPVGIDELVIGEFIWVALKGAVMVTGVTLVLLLVGQVHNPWNILLAPLVGVLVALPLGGMGLLATCFVNNINQFQSVYSFVISPLYFFSGTFFPVEQMPASIQWISKALPLYHGVRLSQSLFWDEDLVSTWTEHVPVLIAYSLVLCTLAYFRVKRKLRT